MEFRQVCEVENQQEMVVCDHCVHMSVTHLCHQTCPTINTQKRQSLSHSVTETTFFVVHKLLSLTYMKNKTKKAKERAGES